MQKRKLGATGFDVSIVGLGCNNFGWRVDIENTRAIIDRAIDRGINFFDTSDSYGASEDFIGEVLGARRKNIVLATKFGSQLDQEGLKKGASRAYILSAIESSLRRLKTDYVDLYQIHFPDPATPIEETLRALEDIIQQGKVRAIGCSNFSPEQIVEAETVAKTAGVHRFMTAQNEYSLLMRGLEASLAPVIDKYKLGLLPYFPLANGLLTGKYKPGKPMPSNVRLANAPAFFDPYKTDEKIAAADRLGKFATECGHTVLELAFSWLASKPAVSSIIAGATSTEQIDQNANAADWALTSEDLKTVDQVLAA